MADADDKLSDLTQDAGKNDHSAEAGDEEPRMPFGHVVVLHPPGHAHEANDIEGHERQIEADKPAPERGFAPALMEPEAERFGEPERGSVKHTKQSAAEC